MVSHEARHCSHPSVAASRSKSRGGSSHTLQWRSNIAYLQQLDSSCMSIHDYNINIYIYDVYICVYIYIYNVCMYVYIYSVCIIIYIYIYQTTTQEKNSKETSTLASWLSFSNSSFVFYHLFYCSASMQQFFPWR